MSNSKYAIGKTSFMAIMFVVSFLIAIVYLNNSWIKFVILGLMLVSGVVWFVYRGSFRRVFKYVVVGVLIFALCFSAFEGYMFWNAGYPPTFGDSQQGVTLSYPNILDASLTEIVQNVKNTPTFKLLMLEYPGYVSITDITLDTGWRSGRVEVSVCPVSANCFFDFRASGGGPYHVTRGSYVKLYDGLMGPFHLQQTPDEALEQIDSLRFQWFYDRAIEVYQNKTGTTPEINELKINFGCGGYGTYYGMMLTMDGSYVDNDRGSIVFSANFQPAGKLNYFNIPI